MADLQTNINQARADFNAIREKIIEKGVDMPNGTPTASYAEKVEQVYDAGRQAEYDAFWDAYQENGNRIDYSNAFSGSGWTRETFKPKYDIPARSNLYMFFYSSGIEGDLDEILREVGITFNTLAGSSNYAFANTKFTALGEVDLSGTRNNGGQMFANNKYLKTIRKLIFAETTILAINAFTEASALENITIEGTIACDIDLHWSTLLTEESITNIINHLSDTTSGKTLTLSATAIYNAFGASPKDWDGDGNEEGWIGSTEWVDLVSTKPNWTIVAI